MEGFKTYRFIDNPKEKEIHDKFIQRVMESGWSSPPEQIIFPNYGVPNGPVLSDHEKQIMISTIQWLGTPVGINFLRDCGFVQKNEKD